MQPENSKESAVNLMDEITQVRLGPILEGVETFTFLLRGSPYQARQEGRLRDYCVLGDDSASDRKLAVMAIADGLTEPCPGEVLDQSARVARFQREDGNSGGNWRCGLCTEQWGAHIAPDSLCPQPPHSAA
jgi:hypothetical protein